MPILSRRPCKQPGCPGLVSAKREQFCPTHAAIERKRYDATRGTPAQRGYDAAWRKTRAAFLRANPYCADIYGVHLQAGQQVRASHVDHIISKRQGGDDARENLQGLCAACHSRKTAVEDHRWG